MRPSSINRLRIGLASPQTIRLWASFVLSDHTTLLREVTEPKFINELGYPILGGLFCQRIFGPSITYRCLCFAQAGVGSTRSKRSKLPPVEVVYNYEPFPRTKLCPRRTLICTLCKVEISPTWVRRYRMGVINLVEPVANVLYLTHIRSILNMSSYQLKRLLFYTDFISYCSKNFSSKAGYQKYFDLNRYGGAYLRALLDSAQNTLIRRYRRLREDLVLIPKKSYRRFVCWRLKQLHLFISSPIKMSWMVLQVLPVLPPRLRPFIQLNHHWFFSSLNDGYKIVVIRNNRLTQFKTNHYMSLNPAHGVPDKAKALYAVQVANLQKGVDKLLHMPTKSNSNQSRQSRGRSSLTTYLHSKYGLFRRNLLGKRVDFSARSVIVSAPHLSFGFCGLPFDMVHELFHPFIAGKMSFGRPKFDMKFDMVDLGFKTVQSEYYRNRDFRAWIQNFCSSSYVYMNRAPTLHRVNLQAFIPQVVPDKAIHFTPLACKGFNADFDGDQMGVFLPITKQARQEAKNRLYTYHHSFEPAQGKLVLGPAQDMMVGLHALRTDGVTSVLHNHHYCASLDDIWTNFDAGLLGTDSIVWFRHGWTAEKPLKCSSFMVTTVGRLILSLMRFS